MADFWSNAKDYYRWFPVAIFYIASAIHIFTYLYFIVKIRRSKSCQGISGKTHILYALVYTTRLLMHLLEYRIDPIDVLFDTVFLTLTGIVALSLFSSFKKTREQEHDTYRVEKLVICCLALPVSVRHYTYHLTHMLRFFSYTLEVAAILPQLHMISKTGHAHTHVLRFLAGLTVSKSLQLLLCFLVPSGSFAYDEDGVLQSCVVIELVILLDFFAWRLVEKRPVWSSADTNGEDFAEVTTVDTKIANTDDRSKENNESSDTKEPK